jgi:adenylylsulfate kinase-like enzyme
MAFVLWMTGLPSSEKTTIIRKVANLAKILLWHNVSVGV